MAKLFEGNGQRDQVYDRNQETEKVRNLWANEQCLRQQAHWDLAGKCLSNGARPRLSEPETPIIWLNYVRSPVSATKYMRETNKSSSAEPLMNEQNL